MYKAKMGNLELLFLGTGTSAGIPMIGCHCDVCTSADPRDRRTRPSAMVSLDGYRVLVDAAPELRLQCIAHGVDMIDAVVFTHGHADHIMGLDDVRRFNALSGKPLPVYADQATHEVLGRCFGYAFKGPDPSERLFRPHLVREVVAGPFDVGPMRWIPIPLVHGSLEILGFRVGRLAYCTDVSAIPEPSYGLLEGLDVLVLDGLQHRKHYTHFTIEEAVAAAARIGAQQTYLTHIAHALAHEATNQSLPASIQLAHDGLRVRARLT